MRAYNLNFISDENLFMHVKETVEKYRFGIDLKKFNKNLIDPIKLTFDSKVYNKTIEEIVEAEIIRQMDKSNTNHIGYFHQNIFNYIDSKWEVPQKGFDLINEEEKIYVEVIAKKSQNTPWRTSLDGEPFEHANIRRVSIDKFYEIVTGE